MGQTLREGDPAPEFDRADQTGRHWRLSELRGRWVVLFFYPRDFSPVCTSQACAFRDSTPRLLAKGAVVLGVSGDDEASHRAFGEKHALPYPLISDADGTLAEMMGVKRRLLGLLPGRETIVIDPQGRVAIIYRSAIRGEEHATRAVAVVEGVPKA